MDFLNMAKYGNFDLILKVLLCEINNHRYAGNKIEEKNLNKLFYSGMEIRIILCCKNNENYLALEMDNSEESLYIRNLPNGQRWRLHVNMTGNGNEITLVNVQDAGEFNV